MFSKKIIASLLSSLMIFATLGTGCMTSPHDDGTRVSALDLSSFNPEVDCHRPAEDVLAEIGVVLSFSSIQSQQDLDAMFAPLAGLCDGVTDAGGDDTTVPDLSTEGGSTTPKEGPAIARTDLVAGLGTGLDVIHADVFDTVLKCILGIVGADVALDVYEAIKVPWKAGLRGGALAKDAGEILWNRVKKKGLKYALKAAGGIGGAIACFVDIVGAVAAVDTDNASVARTVGAGGPGCPAARDDMMATAR